nr:hypothetical protein [Desulfosarcina cetonica]
MAQTVVASQIRDGHGRADDETPLFDAHALQFGIVAQKNQRPVLQPIGLPDEEIGASGHADRIARRRQKRAWGSMASSRAATPRR